MKFVRPKTWRGTLLGTALGDAWGRETEFMSREEIEALHGPAGPPLPEKAVVTDDTQMTLSLAQAIISTTSPDNFRVHIASSYITWRNDPRNDTTRAPGLTSIRTLTALQHYGLPRWPHSTDTNSKGCGANMRVAPAAYLPTPYVEPVALWQAALTHAHPTALVASWLTAALTRALYLEDTQPGEALRWATDWVDARSGGTLHLSDITRNWMAPLRRATNVPLGAYLTQGFEEMGGALTAAARGLGEDRLGDPAAYGGEGWVAEEALATAALCLDRFPDAPLSAIRHATASGGDSDSLAAITGALVGAADPSAVEPCAPHIERFYRNWIDSLT